MKKPKYSIAAHLIHSRLQLVASGLIIKPDNMGVTHPGNVVWQNKWLFEQAKKSVETDHGIEVSLNDMADAASLVMASRVPHLKGGYVVQQQIQNVWKAVKTEKGRGGCVPADFGESFTFKEAAEIYSYISASGPSPLRIAPFKK